MGSVSAGYLTVLFCPNIVMFVPYFMKTDRGYSSRFSLTSCGAKY